jgi:hypothetical protein
LLLGCFRVAWLCCTAAVAAMLPALVLRSTVFVALFELGLVCCFLALGVAALLAVVTLTRREVNGMPLPRRHGARVATLVAVLLADLLDRD